MSAAPKLERVLLSQSRDREYFDVNELRTMTGQPASKFPDVVVKELCDNALDAAEQAGVAPRLVIQLWRRQRDLVLCIKDNGAGITPETVDSILDFKTRTSDKAAYRSITRGLQGNALKTVLGIPYALGSRQPLVVEARGKKYVLRPHIDPAGIAQVNCTVRDVADRGGTRWTLALPLKACANLSLIRWARGFSLFNPHATVKLREVCAPSELAQTDAQEEPSFSPPTAEREKIGGSRAPSELSSSSEHRVETHEYFPSDRRVPRRVEEIPAHRPHPDPLVRRPLAEETRLRPHRQGAAGRIGLHPGPIRRAVSRFQGQETTQGRLREVSRHQPLDRL
jgi:hypothetical protein